LCQFNQIQKFVLLYRGSLHGFKAYDFHSKCDNIPKTLTVIKATKSGNIFGGYTEATWDGQEIAKRDENAFIFSLVNKENSPLKVNVAKVENAIACYPEYGPIFGFDSDAEDDLSIYDDSGISDFGGSYIIENYPKYSTNARSFLAGSFQFNVKEIEVFQVK
jgi:hypothetical protein